MILVLFGPPGSGKGTQAEFLKSELGLYHLSVGAFLREEIKFNPVIRDRFSSFMDAGSLLPDEDVIGIVCDKLSKVLSAGIVLLDGFPRSLPQANALVAFCDKMNEDLVVLNIELDDSDVAKRLSCRLTCNACHAPFSMSENCPFCGSLDYSKRSDDESDVILNRINTYRNTFGEILSFLNNKKIFKVDGNCAINKVKEEIFNIVNKLKKEKL